MQLFDSQLHKITFSEKHDFTLENVFDVQDEIGRRIVDSLHARFPLAAPMSRERYSSDPEAYNVFMAGLRESSADQPDALRIAAEHLSRAVERDPDFAVAHATLSLVSMNLHFQFDAQRMWLQQAEDHCRLALTIDPTLPEGHLARALDSPRSFGHTHHVHHNVACVYALLADTDKAMVWLERAADTGFPCWPFFRIDPNLESLRQEPAFTRLVADLEQKYATLTTRR
jgi:hypothetical protein